MKNKVCKTEGNQKGKEKAKRKSPLMKKGSLIQNYYTLLEDNPTNASVTIVVNNINAIQGMRRLPV